MRLKRGMRTDRSGFPPTLGIDTIKSRIFLAEQAGYVLPKDAAIVMKASFHKLSVEAASATGKKVPDSVLKEYQI